MGVIENEHEAEIAQEYDPTYGTVEAEIYEPEPAKKLNFIDKFVLKCHDFERWVTENYRDLLFLLLIVTVSLGVYSINVAFYILGKVRPEDWTFIDTGVAEGFYTTWMVLVSMAIPIVFCVPIFERYPSYTKTWWIPWFILACSLALFIGLPFGLVTHYRHVEYNQLCQNNLYELEVINRGVYFEGNHIYDIKTSSGNDGKTITVKTGPIPPNQSMMETTFCCGNNQIMYGQKLDLFDSSIRSRSEKWYEKRADFDGNIKYMQHPSEDNTVKICTDKLGNKTLEITTIIPVMQERMRTCRGCMENCMDECVRWETRYVPYSYTTCSGSGASRSCSTHSGIRAESYCAQYRSYSECKARCDAPACMGITL